MARAGSERINKSDIVPRADGKHYGDRVPLGDLVDKPVFPEDYKRPDSPAAMLTGGDPDGDDEKKFLEEVIISTELGAKLARLPIVAP